MNTLPDIAFAIVLALAACVGVLVAQPAKRLARFYMQFAACLYVALAIGNVIAALDGGVMSGFFAGGLALFASTLGPPALVFAIACVQFRAPGSWLAAFVLLGALLSALAAAATAVPVLAFAPLFASSCAMLAMALRLWRKNRRIAVHLIVSAGSLIAGAAAFMSGGMGGRTAMGMFAAAALLGVAIVLATRSHQRIKTVRGETLADGPLIRRGG